MMRTGTDRKKQIAVILLCAVLAAGLTACGTSDKWIFSLNGEELYDKDITIFGLIYTKEYNIVDREQLREKHENGGTYAQYYKEKLEDEMVSTVLLYKEAKDAKCKLTEKEEETVKENAENLMNTYGRQWLKEKGISNKDIEQIYEMKLLGNSYLDHLSEFQSLVKGAEDSKQDRYIRVYQVTFPIVELDEDGLVQSDQDGTIKKLSDNQISEMETIAQGFSEQVQGGEDIEALSKEYDNIVIGMDRYIKYDDLDTEYKNAVDNLSVNEVSGVISASNGFYVIKLLDSDAVEHGEAMASYSDDAAKQQQREELLESLYSTYVRDDKNYKNQEKWDEVNFLAFVQ